MKNILKIYALPFGLAFVIAIFFLYTYGLENFYSPQKDFKKLISSQQIKPLGPWEQRYLSCPSEVIDMNNCLLLEENSKPIDFPQAENISETVRNMPQAPSHVSLTYTPSKEQVDWARNQKIITLSLPRNLRNSISAQIGSKLKTIDAEYTATGQVRVRDDALRFLGKDFNENDRIVIKMNIKNLPWFGPADLPIALTDFESEATYEKLIIKQVLLTNVKRGIQLAIFLILIGMAIILDHSKSFRLLSFYAFLKAILLSMAIVSESYSLTIGKMHDVVSFMVNLGIIVLFPILIATITQFRLRKRLYLATAFLAALTFLGLKAKFPSVLYDDVIADISATGFSIIMLIILMGSWVHRKVFEQSNKKTAQNPDEFIKMRKFSSAIRLGIVCLGLGIHFYINLQELSSSSDQFFSDVFDWKHDSLFYILILACLMEIGSTSKSMLKNSHKLVKQAITERDIAMGRIVQENLLPPRKGSHLGFTWRNFYYPADQLAGDWYDIQIVKNNASGNTYIVSCMIDVTGHGIAAAMITSTVSSLWGLWVKNNILTTKSQIEAPQLQSALEDAIHRIQEGLKALRHNQGCSGAFFIVDCNHKQMSYATCGHPGIILLENNLSYLATGNPRFSHERFSAKVATRNLKAGFTLFSYTDGIIKRDIAVSRWVRGIFKSASKGNLAFKMVKEIQATRRDYRRNKKLEDDISLTIVSCAAPQSNKLQPATKRHSESA